MQHGNQTNDLGKQEYNGAKNDTEKAFPDDFGLRSPRSRKTKNSHTIFTVACDTAKNIGWRLEQAVMAIPQW